MKKLKIINLILVFLFAKGSILAQNTDSTIHENLKNTQIKNNQQSKKVNISIIANNIIRFEDYSICYLNFNNINNKNIDFEVVENGLPINFKAQQYKNEFLLKLPNDKLFKLFSIIDGVKHLEIEISTNKFVIGEPVELNDRLYNIVTTWQVLNYKDELPLNKYIMEEKFKDVSIFEKISFLQKHTMKGVPFQKQMAEVTGKLFATATVNNLIHFEGKQTRPPNPWEDFYSDYDKIVWDHFPLEIYELGCRCTYIVNVGFQMQPKSNVLQTNNSIFVILNNDEKARKYFPVLSTNDLGGYSLNQPNWGPTRWRDGFRNEFGAAKNMALWSSGWKNLFNTPPRDSVKLSTLGTPFGNQGNNFDQQSYSLLCTSSIGIKEDCGCSKDLTIKFKYDNVLSTNVTLHGSGNVNSKSWAVGMDNAIAMLNEAGTSLTPASTYTLDFGLSGISASCNLTKTPDFIKAKQALITSIGDVAANAILLYAFVQLGIPSGTNLNNLTSAQLTSLDSVFNIITGMSFPNFVQSLVNSVTTVVNNAITLGNTPKYTPGSCGGTSSSNAQNIIDKIINFQLKSNRPITLTLSSFHSMEIGGERSFTNSIDISSGGYIGVYMDPAYYPSNNGVDNCCSEKYGRWLQTSFGPVVEQDYLDDLSNFFYANGAPFYNIYPPGAFAGPGLFGNTGAIRGNKPDDCKPIEIFDGNKTTNNFIEIEETPANIQLHNNTNKTGNYGVVDMLGKLISSGNVQQGSSLKIDKSKLAAGIYIINTTSGVDTKSYKISIN